MSDKTQLITGLNIAIEREYQAAIQYVQHAAVITGAQYDSIQKELLVHAQEELQHAILLAEQVAFLGGTPTTEVAKRNTSKDSATMLKQDLAGEEEAITMYKKLIDQAEEIKEYGLRHVLESILIQEEEHKRDLLMALDQ